MKKIIPAGTFAFKVDCSKCGEEFEIWLRDQNPKFSPKFKKNIKCSDCAWGGKAGMKRHVQAADRLERALKKGLYNVTSVSTSPGPQFSIPIEALSVKRNTLRNRTKDGVEVSTLFTFQVPDFEGAPVHFSLRVKK
jgi:hypothetical protein